MAKTLLEIDFGTNCKVGKALFYSKKKLYRRTGDAIVTTTETTKRLPDSPREVDVDRMIQMYRALIE